MARPEPIASTAGASWRALARAALLLLALLSPAAHAQHSDTPEYRVKAAFLYNFAAFTEWPADVGGTLNLCIVGPDPFRAELEPLQGKAVGGRSLAVHRRAVGAALGDCQIVYVGSEAAGQLPRVADALRGQPALIVSDAAGALQHGAMLNMTVVNSRITFEASVVAARAARLALSSKLLRLATGVVQ
jgi:hypothetical protein